MGSHSHDRKPKAFRVVDAALGAGAPNSPSDLESIHSGQHHVHQHEIERIIRDPLERLLAVVDHDGLTSELRKHRRRHPLVHGIVLDDQDAERTPRTCGRTAGVAFGGAGSCPASEATIAS